MRAARGLIAALLVLGACTADASERSLVLGALYPQSGTQGRYGTDELGGVRIAVEMINERGGIGGRPVELRTVDAVDVQAAWDGAHRLARADVPVIIGSYGSTLSLAASEVAHDEGMIYWETGAVADLVTARGYPEVFRTGPSGATLAAQAASFAAEVLAPRFDIPSSSLRVSVLYEDGPYGASVGEGILREARARGFRLVGHHPYDPATEGFEGIIDALERERPDVVVAATYLEDGARFRERMLAAGLRVKALIAKCAAFYTQEMAALLGDKIDGIFVADKPMDVGARALARDARLLEAEFERRFKARFERAPMAAATMGFSGAWALLAHVMPRATSLDADAIARAALALDLPQGSLPNGAGIRFAPADDPMAGQNLRALGVVWQWQKGDPVLVYPPAAARGEPLLASR